MSYVNSTLLENETILYFTRPHWVVFLQTILTFIVTIFLFSFGSIYRTLSFLTFFVSVFQGALAYINYTFSEYVITNKRILMKTGFISRRSLEIFLHRIESIYIEQTILGRILNYGSVIIIGIGGTKDPFYFIPSPIEFRARAQQELEKASKIVELM